MSSDTRRTAPIGIAVGAVVALTVIRLVTMMALFSIDGDAPIGTHPLHWLVMALNAALCTALIVGAIAVAKMSPADLGWSRFVAARDVPWALAALVVAAAFPIVAYYLDSGSFGAVVDAAMKGPLVSRIVFCVIGVLAAFSEESVFRGLLQPSLEKKMPWPAALAVMCVVFSLYHLPRHPIAFVGRILTGLAYGGAARKTGALWAGALAHFLTWALLGEM
jgi:membrane protease YdiL (CAAX protease family)